MGNKIFLSINHITPTYLTFRLTILTMVTKMVTKMVIKRLNYNSVGF